MHIVYWYWYCVVLPSGHSGAKRNGSAAAESSLREATQACADLFGDLSESAFPEVSALLVLEAELKYFRGD